MLTGSSSIAVACVLRCSYLFYVAQYHHILLEVREFQILVAYKKVKISSLNKKIKDWRRAL